MKAEGRIKLGIPVLRWVKDAENDLRELKMKRWSQQANERDEWTSVLKDVKVLR
jgi:hypothetical protein